MKDNCLNLLALDLYCVFLILGVTFYMFIFKLPSKKREFSSEFFKDFVQWWTYIWTGVVQLLNWTHQMCPALTIVSFAKDFLFSLPSILILLSMVDKAKSVPISLYICLI